jgi:DNA-binding CsgD family transcriptional regulator
MIVVDGRRGGAVPSAPALLGRRTELALIEQLIADPAPRPRGIALAGEAGIGKTILWQTGIEHASAHGRPVLSTRRTEPDTDVSFAALGELLAPVVADAWDVLPEPQRVALEVALGGRPPGAEQALAGAREVGAAVLGVLRRVCATGPALLAIDDLPWLDRASLDALHFALRRLTVEPLRVLVSRRAIGAIGLVPDGAAPVPELLAADAMDVVRLGPVDAAIIDQLLAERLGLRLPQRMVERLVQQTGGNPLWALEVADVLPGTQAVDTTLPIPQSLSSLVSRRLAGLHEPAREALIVASAMPQPTLSLTSAALATAVSDPNDAIDEAVRAGVVVESAGRLRPAHPLLGSAVLEALPSGRRSALHRRLAAVVLDPEQHARHLALAAGDEPDRELADALDAGAATARARGATYAAAELAERSIRLTPPEAADDLRSRHLVAAELFLQVGDMERSRTHAAASRGGDLGTERRALQLQVETTYWVHGRQAAQELVAILIDDAATDRHLRAVALALAADVGDTHATPRAELAERAIELFDTIGDSTDAQALSTALRYLALARLDAGDGIPWDLVRRMEALQRDQAWIPPVDRVSVLLAYWRKCVDDLDGSRADLRQAIADARDEGEDAVVPALFGHLALTECWAGRYAAGQGAVEIALRNANTGMAPVVLHVAQALLYILTGEVEVGRSLIATRMPSDGSSIDAQRAVVYEHVLGFAALLQGRDDEAVQRLWTAYERAREAGLHDPGRRQRLEGDLGQALINTGRLDDARALAAELHAFAERTERPTLLGIAARIDGLTHAAGGDLDAAVAELRRAVSCHEVGPMPLEHGRSLLALGQILRLRKESAAARGTLEQALTCFTELGAVPFVQMAQAELDRTQRTRTRGALTPSERQVAELVASGLTNREVAARLFTSVRTVEGHLAAVYRKLGMRSRTELAKRAVDGLGQPAHGSGQ